MNYIYVRLPSEPGILHHAPNHNLPISSTWSDTLKILLSVSLFDDRLIQLIQESSGRNCRRILWKLFKCSS